MVRFTHMLLLTIILGGVFCGCGSQGGADGNAAKNAPMTTETMTPEQLDQERKLVK